MRIDGKVFLVLLGCCTLVLAVTTVWLWPRLAGSGAKALTGRISLLLATQLSLAATFLFTVNALGGFYTSWGQLFGTASAKYTVTDQGPANAAQDDARALVDGSRGSDGSGGSGSSGGSGGSTGSGSSGGSGGLGGSGGSGGSASSGPGGSSRTAGSHAGAPFATAELTGPRSGLTAALQIFPPTDYTSRATTHRRYPVEVVDLTGDATGLSAAAYHQIADTYQVMVVVVGPPAPATPAAAAAPATSAIPGVNVPHGAQGQIFWTQDLPGALRAHYRVDTSAPAWGVAGVGQDGTAAINLAVQDPAYYSLAAAGGDWTHTAAPESWPGIQTYLASVPLPDVSLLYDPASGAVPAKIQASGGALRIIRRSPLTLAGELDWLGTSLDANTDVHA